MKIKTNENKNERKWMTVGKFNGRVITPPIEREMAPKLKPDFFLSSQNGDSILYPLNLSVPYCSDVQRRVPSPCLSGSCTTECLQIQRIFFEILINQTEIRLYLPLSDWFGSKRTEVRFQINRCMLNTIWFRFDLIRFRKDFSVFRS